jgi:hypothetical protein
MDRQTELGKGAKFGLNQKGGGELAVNMKSVHVPNTRILAVCFKLNNSDEYGFLGCNAV